MEHTKIDPKTATPEEVKKEIERLKALASDCKNEEQGIKLVLNSVYGSTGNKWFVAFNVDVAESITIQGQDLWKYAEATLNGYFKDQWHLDTELHAKMGIGGAVRAVKKPVVIYGDTDSCYVTFEEVLKSCEWSKSAKEFILLINQHRLKEFLQMKFDEYSVKWGCAKNYQDFELENISESGIWLGKKKYMLDPIWEDGIDVEAGTKFVYKGVELAQGVTPPFVRKKLKELVSYIFEKKNKLVTAEMIKLLKEIKTEFKLAQPEDISKGVSINGYNTYILNDTTAIETVKQTPIQIRASAVYNNVLMNNKVHKAKYELIRDGAKVKWYYVKTKSAAENDVFAFLPGYFPYEFAPPIDYDTQFSNLLIMPINRIMEAMGLAPIPFQLVTAHPVF